jgi:hypothetical protein
MIQNLRNALDSGYSVVSATIKDRKCRVVVEKDNPTGKVTRVFVVSLNYADRLKLI